MEIRDVRLSGVEGDEDPLLTCIYLHVLDAIDPLQRLAQPADALVAIFTLGCDLNRFQNRLIAVLWKKRTGWIGIVGSGWVHLIN
jgi:hypothetical protein